MEAKSIERKKGSMEKPRKDVMVEEEVEDELDEEDEPEDDKKKGVLGSSRRGSGGAGGVSPPSCQAERCGADLTDAKRYHRRHKVCEFHSKAPVVMVAGQRQRFCQQCSRFHDLSEFDEAKRSCRRRLVGHNERRRRLTAEYCNEGSRPGKATLNPKKASAGMLMRGGEIR